MITASPSHRHTHAQIHAYTNTHTHTCVGHGFVDFFKEEDAQNAVLALPFRGCKAEFARLPPVCVHSLLPLTSSIYYIRYYEQKMKVFASKAMHR